jgi:hypothetical protein
MLEITKILFSTLASPHAYLDPGSGSFLIQILIAAALGAAVAFRGYWAKLWGMITGKKKDSNDEDDEA